MSRIRVPSLFSKKSTPEVTTPVTAPEPTEVELATAAVAATTPATKTKTRACEVTEAEFTEMAGSLVLKLGDVEIPVPARVFSTGTLGWYGRSAKKGEGDAPITIEFPNGKRVTLSYQIQFYVNDSKPRARKS